MPRTEIDPYLILGIAFDATPQEIRAAYLRLVRQLHPDSSRKEDDTAAARLAGARDAFHVLQDPVKRAAVDARVRASMTVSSRTAVPEAAAAASASSNSQQPSSSPRITWPADRSHRRDPQRSAPATSKIPKPPETDEEIVIDIDLPIDELWDTSPPAHASTSPYWQAKTALLRMLRAMSSSQLMLPLGTFVAGVAGYALMANDATKLLGVTMLVAAPIAYYVGRRGVS